MQIQQYYKLFEIDRTASQEEIKKSYRRLAIRFHPDTGGSAREFLFVQEAYQWLSKNHVQQAPPKPKVQPQKFDGIKLYRIFTPSFDREKKAWFVSTLVPFKCNATEKVQLMCMWDGMEFRVIMDQTVTFPITVEVTGLPKKLFLTIYEEIIQSNGGR